MTSPRLSVPTRQTVHGRELAVLRLSDAAVVLSSHRVRSLCHWSSVGLRQAGGPVRHHLRFFHHHSAQVQLRFILCFLHCFLLFKKVYNMSPTALMGSEANSERAKVQQFQYNDEIITLFFGNSNVILYVFLLERRDAEMLIYWNTKTRRHKDSETQRLKDSEIF